MKFLTPSDFFWIPRNFLKVFYDDDCQLLFQAVIVSCYTTATLCRHLSFSAQGWQLTSIGTLGCPHGPWCRGRCIEWGTCFGWGPATLTLTLLTHYAYHSGIVTLWYRLLDSRLLYSKTYFVIRSLWVGVHECSHHLVRFRPNAVKFGRSVGRNLRRCHLYKLWNSNPTYMTHLTRMLDSLPLLRLQ